MYLTRLDCNRRDLASLCECRKGHLLQPGGGRIIYLYKAQSPLLPAPAHIIIRLSPHYGKYISFRSGIAVNLKSEGRKEAMKSLKLQLKKAYLLKLAFLRKIKEKIVEYY